MERRDGSLPLRGGQVSALTETVLRQSAEIFRLNELLKTLPDPASVEGHSALRGDWVPA